MDAFLLLRRDVPASSFCCLQTPGTGLLDCGFETSWVGLSLAFLLRPSAIYLFSLAQLKTLVFLTVLLLRTWLSTHFLATFFLLISSITKQPVSSSILHAFYSSALADVMRPPPMVYEELPLSMIPPSHNSLRQLQFLLSIQLSKVNLKSIYNLFSNDLHHLTWFKHHPIQQIV